MEGVEETLDWLAIKSIFTTFYLKYGCLQVELEEEYRPYTAVRTTSGRVQYHQLSKGLKNGPFVSQRIMNTVLGRHNGRSVW